MTCSNLPIPLASLLILFALFGCGSSGTNTSGNQQAAEVNYQSPKEVFAAIQDSWRKGDFDTYLRCFTAESRNIMVGQAVLGLDMWKNRPDEPNVKDIDFDKEEPRKKVGDEAPPKGSEKNVKFVNKIAAKHPGIEQAFQRFEEFKQKFKTKQPSRQELKQFLATVAEPIKDKVAFFDDAMTAWREVSKGADANEFWGKANLKLVNIKEQGDHAVAQIDQGPGPGRYSEVSFRRTDHSWRMELPEELINP